MTYARAHLVDTENDGFYHCISRCVRRAWLCGADRESGRSFDHRRRWLEDRVLYLGQAFCLDVFGFAVMSNHYHLVARVRPRQAIELTDQQVAERWALLESGKSEKDRADVVAQRLEDAEWLAQARQRLGSLSWFMRYLNEPLARIANREDECTGRFWEGRFKSYALLDETAILAAMVYVDLNPYRAGQVDEPETAPHTSIGLRVGAKDERLAPLSEIGLSLADYVGIVRWTAKPASVRSSVTSKLAYQHPQWRALVQANGRHYRAYGSVALVRAFVKIARQLWIKGRELRGQVLA